MHLLIFKIVHLCRDYQYPNFDHSVGILEHTQLGQSSLFSDDRLSTEGRLSTEPDHFTADYPYPLPYTTPTSRVPTSVSAPRVSIPRLDIKAALDLQRQERLKGHVVAVSHESHAMPAHNLSSFDDPVFPLRLANTAPGKGPVQQLPMTLQISQISMKKSPIPLIKPKVSANPSSIVGQSPFASILLESLMRAQWKVRIKDNLVNFTKLSFKKYLYRVVFLPCSTFLIKFFERDIAAEWLPDLVSCPHSRFSYAALFLMLIIIMI